MENEKQTVTIVTYQQGNELIDVAHVGELLTLTLWNGFFTIVEEDGTVFMLNERFVIKMQEL